MTRHVGQAPALHVLDGVAHKRRRRYADHVGHGQQGVRRYHCHSRDVQPGHQQAPDHWGVLILCQPAVQAQVPWAHHQVVHGGEVLLVKLRFEELGYAEFLCLCFRGVRPRDHLIGVLADDLLQVAQLLAQVGPVQGGSGDVVGKLARCLVHGHVAAAKDRHLLGGRRAAYQARQRYPVISQAQAQVQPVSCRPGGPGSGGALDSCKRAEHIHHQPGRHLLQVDGQHAGWAQGPQFHRGRRLGGAHVFPRP